jgi:hypothetical protein
MRHGETAGSGQLQQLGTKHQALGTKERKGHLMKGGHRGYRDLKVYKLAYELAMDIFEVTKSFPPEERYSLTDQIRKSSRSVVLILQRHGKGVNIQKCS